MANNDQDSSNPVDTGNVPVVFASLRQPTPTNDQAFWVRIRACLDGRSFEEYEKFVDRVLRSGSGQLAGGGSFGGCSPKDQMPCDPKERYAHGVHGYVLLKAATEVYLLCHACCTDDMKTPVEMLDGGEDRSRGLRMTNDELSKAWSEYIRPGTIPYLDRIIRSLGYTSGTESKFFPARDTFRDMPCMFELIWSYWHEEGMLVQALNAIALRFQNQRVRSKGREPLANLAIDPLRPLNNLLWGYIQDENNRLTVRRRTYEYEHHYGLRLIGKAVGNVEAAERRSRFLEAFHNLLHRASVFYKDSQNLMMAPDGFPLVEAIRAVHLLLAEGAHNQWGDLPSTARAEMLIQQWLLSQPPMREFLQARAMITYEEGWMSPLDAMKRMMGWTDVSVIHFHKLATFGERILLSVRFGDWNATTVSAEQAKNWVLYWKPEIQGYIESYRVATGVDLSAPLVAGTHVDATLPAVHLSRAAQQGKDGG